MLLYLGIPVALNVLALIFWRGWARAASAITLFFLAAAFGLDAYSYSQGGNLTGLFTMIVAPVALGVLALTGIGVLARSSSRRA